MSVSLDANAECPFFIGQDEKCIDCESYIGKKVKHKNAFKNKFDRLKYFRDVCCCDGGRHCMHNKVMTSLYERGVLK
jgi:hypothetical protein